MDDLATYANPPLPPPSGRILLVHITTGPDQLASILGTIFGQLGPGQAYLSPLMQTRYKLPSSLISRMIYKDF